MFKLAEKAVEIADKHRADYADIRVIEARSQHTSVKNGEVSALSDSVSLGYGVRVLWGGAWGFASSDRMTAGDIEAAALRALAIAKASATLRNGRVRLAAEPAWQDFWQTPFRKDPFLVPQEDKLALLAAADKELRKDRRIHSALSQMNCRREHKWFMNTAGSRIEQVLLNCGAGYTATAVDKGEVQVRSYPYTHGGEAHGGGYELVEGLDLAGNAERVRGEAIALLTAPPCPAGEKDLIIYGNQLALQIHESVGHASELDRVLGYEESYAGSSFATTEKLGRFRYGSPLVNLVADATLPCGLATAGYDDDGVKAQRWHIVKDGILSGYMTNREFCGRIGMKRSYGCNRADGFDSIPITRICNLSLMPGATPYEQLLGETKDGIMMENNKSWSIDQKRLNFQFGCEIGWIIKNGRKVKMVRNPVYQGITPVFWGSCEAIADHASWRHCGVMNCGKGQPTQTAQMTHASSPARFARVKVGVHA